MTSSHYKADEAKKQLKEWIDLTQDDRVEIKAIALDVIWGKDGRYWTLPTDPEKPLQLHQVAWLEVSCRIPLNRTNLKPDKPYKVEFEVSMEPESAFGWSGCPVYLMVKVGSKRNLWKSADLSLLTKDRGGPHINLIPSAAPLTFTVSKEDNNAELNVGLFEVWRGGWKGGLNIHKVIIVGEFATTIMFATKDDFGHRRKTKH